MDFERLQISVNDLASTHDGIADTLRSLVSVTEEEFMETMGEGDFLALIGLLTKTAVTNKDIHEGLMRLLSEDPTP